MKHEILLEHIEHGYRWTCSRDEKPWDALEAVVKLHSGKGIRNRCVTCASGTKCETIKVIEKELGL